MWARRSRACSALLGRRGRPAFFRAGQPARSRSSAQCAGPGRRRRHDPRDPGPPDRHLHRLAVRDLRRRRGPAGQGGAADAARRARARWRPARSSGAINGALVAGLGLPAIVVTLATMVVLREGLRWATEGVWVQDLPARLPVVRPRPGRRRAGRSSLAALRRSSRRSPGGCAGLAAGRAVYATGSDAEAARLVGHAAAPRGVRGVFVVMGALTGLAALLTADPVHRRADERRRRPRAARDRGGRRGRHRHLRRARVARGHARRRRAARHASARRSRSSARQAYWERALQGADHPARGLGRRLRACGLEGRRAAEPRVRRRGCVARASRTPSGAAGAAGRGDRVLRARRLATS